MWVEYQTSDYWEPNPVNGKSASPKTPLPELPNQGAWAKVRIQKTIWPADITAAITSHAITDDDAYIKQCSYFLRSVTVYDSMDKPITT